MPLDHHVRLAERELRSYLLYRVCALLAIASISYLLIVTILGPHLPWVYATFAVGLVALGGLVATRRGFITSTSLVLLSVVAISIIVTTMQVGLLHNAMSLFLLAILSGLLLGGPGAIGGTFAAVAIAVVGSYLEHIGVISAEPQNPALTAVTVSGEVIVVGILLYWTARGRRQTLQHLLTTTTNLDQTQQRFAELVHDLADGVIVADIEGVILSVNPAMEKMLGHPASEIVGRHFWKLPFLTPTSIPEIRDNFERLLRGEDLRRVEVSVETDKGVLIVDAAPRMYERADGGLEISATVRDITERVRAAEELAQLEAQLQESRRLEALGRLAGGVAHDFNNWLTLIVGHAELLRDEFGDNEGLDAISEAAESSTALTRQLLTFARQQPSEPRPVRVAKVLDRLTPMLKRLVDRRVELHSNLTTDDAVLIDPSQFEQIVMNLVLNASEAMSGPGNIELRAETVVVDGKRLVSIDVIDDGPGVPEANRALLFEPFFTTKSKGTGLGLATVHGVVTGAGGEIHLVGADRGAHFNVRLPALAVEDEALGA